LYVTIIVENKLFIIGVPPPKSGAVWIVYEYAGLSTLETYAVPGEIRRAKIPPERTIFGIKEPPKLPDWNDRANFVINGIIKQSIIAIATMHESGVVHRSLGRTSLILSNKAMDKRDSASPFNTNISQLRIKLSDFGFSGLFETSTLDKEFCTRAKLFDLNLQPGENSILSTNFAIAEDMHALGLGFLGLLLSSLAELPNKDYKMPATDDESLQRLLVDIFDKDLNQFREYVDAEDIWSKLVELLDENDSSGWKMLETLILARESVAETKERQRILTVRSLLANPIFKNR
jgi:serine/threonine protein kinase